MVLAFEDDSPNSVAGVISELAMASSLKPYSDAKAISDLIPYKKAIINSVVRRAPPDRVNLLILFTV
jgi:hypothetical protein